jgi:hypothetical protein
MLRKIQKSIQHTKEMIWKDWTKKSLVCSRKWKNTMTSLKKLKQNSEQNLLQIQLRNPKDNPNLTPSYLLFSKASILNL